MQYVNRVNQIHVLNAILMLGILVQPAQAAHQIYLDYLLVITASAKMDIMTLELLYAPYVLQFALYVQLRLVVKHVLQIYRECLWLINVVALKAIMILALTCAPHAQHLASVVVVLIVHAHHVMILLG